MIRRPPAPVRERIGDLRVEAQMHEQRGDSAMAWSCLGDAHVLSQPWAVPHVAVHRAMLGLGWRSGSVREVLGQLVRLIAAGPASVAGRFPLGNSGRADVSAFAPAPVREDLAALLDRAELMRSGTKLEVNDQSSAGEVMS